MVTVKAQAVAATSSGLVTGRSTWLMGPLDASGGCCPHRFCLLCFSHSLDTPSNTKNAKQVSTSDWCRYKLWGFFCMALKPTIQASIFLGKQSADGEGLVFARPSAIIQKSSLGARPEPDPTLGCRDTLKGG